MIEINGKKAIQLCKVIECAAEYYIDEDGVFYRASGLGFDKIVTTYSNNGLMVAIQIGGSKADWQVNALLIRALKKRELWVEDEKPKDQKSKLLAIGFIDGDGYLQLHHNHIYANVDQVKTLMEEAIKKYPGKKLVKLELSDTLELVNRPQLVWSEA